MTICPKFSTIIARYGKIGFTISVVVWLGDSMRALLVATTNLHKLEEFRAIFSDLPYTLLSLSDVQLDMDVEETGETFQENSVLKALTYARASGLLTLADDSGLEIDAMGGAPGVYSARFAGVSTPYEERFKIIFNNLQGLPAAQRTARFRSVITIAEPSGYHRSVDGTIEGLITETPRGDNGFGYDPIFLVPELGKTTAEISPELKNQMSHRGRAARLAHELLCHWPSSPSTSQ
jgi:XTP/dITP diphosphohydrolase